jgi:pyruvate dehydrogenase phosphatase
MIDTSNDDLYIASTGDCRAIAGYIEPLTRACIVEELTEDQTGRNPNEIAR